MPTFLSTRATATATATALALAASLFATEAAATSNLEAIDDAFRAGRIDFSERTLYRVAAIRAPESLPRELRQSDLRPAPEARSHTGVLIDAHQAMRTLSPPAATALRDLLAPPPDLTHWVETTTPYPIRVSYSSPSQQSKAERVLQAAITSYERQVEDWGFWEPAIEEGVEFYRFYVMNAGGAAGYTAPYLDVPTTPRTDSYSYIVIDPSLNGLSIDATVAHEFNHACQIAMDSQEVRSFLENTASYIEAVVFPSTWPITQSMFPAFQRQPYQRLEYMRLFDSDGYEYGGALWALFLNQTYGDGDPRWLRQVWEGCVQDSYDNEPDYFDVLETMLAADGGLAAAASLFSEHRFFVGRDDDGQHLPGADVWRGAEVWRSATYLLNQLPVFDRGPLDDSTWPQPNGCNYVVVDQDSGGGLLPLRFTFDGDESVPWDVRVLAAGGSQPTSSQPIGVDDQGQGELTVQAGSAERMVLVVCQRAEEAYDPDESAWNGASYRYGIELDTPPPTVTSLSPSELEQGARDVVVTIRGRDFYPHANLAVAVSGSLVTAWFQRFVSSEEIEVRMSATVDAALGPRDVQVTLPGGSPGVGEGVLTIVAPVGPETATDDTSTAAGGGCACSHAPARGAPWALLLAGAAFARSRRRRRSPAPAR